MPEPSPSRRWSRRRLVVTGVLVVLLLPALLFAYQATRTGLAVFLAKRDVDRVSSQVEHGDAAGARRTMRDLAHQAHVAHAHSDNALWSAAAKLPWLGGDFRALRVGSRSLDSAAQRALPAALRLYGALAEGKLRRSSGTLDTAAISRLRPEFAALHDAVAPATERLDRVRTGDLVLPPVRHLTRDFQDSLDSLTTFSRTGITATRLLPAMLGADGPRHYLLVAQTNAEIRATGGLPGSFSIVSVDDGKIELGRQLTKYDFPYLPEPVVPLTRQELAMHSTQMGIDVRDANVTPDMPRAAQIISAMYTRRFGEKLDGVIFIDPFVLSAVLHATGAVAVGSETVDSHDIVRKMLNTVYLRHPKPDDQDAYFSRTSRRIFYVVTRRTKINEIGMLRGLAEVAGQRRLLVWSSHPDEEAQLAETAIAGALPRGRHARVRAGMYLNDATSGKMAYYLDYVGGVRSIGCTKAGVQRFQARLRLRSKAPADASSLNSTIVGLGRHVAKGSMLDRLFVYGPSGGKVVSLVANGEDRELIRFRDKDRPVVFQNLVLHPGGSIVMTATFETAPGSTGRPTFDWTPGMHRGDTSVSAASTCR